MLNSSLATVVCAVALAVVSASDAWCEAISNEPPTHVEIGQKSPHAWINKYEPRPLPSYDENSFYLPHKQLSGKFTNFAKEYPFTGQELINLVLSFNLSKNEKEYFSLTHGGSVSGERRTEVYPKDNSHTGGFFLDVYRDARKGEPISVNISLPLDMLLLKNVINDNGIFRREYLSGSNYEEYCFSPHQLRRMLIEKSWEQILDSETKFRFFSRNGEQHRQGLFHIYGKSTEKYSIGSTILSIKYVLFSDRIFNNQDQAEQHYCAISFSFSKTVAN